MKGPNIPYNNNNPNFFNQIQGNFQFNQPDFQIHIPQETTNPNEEQPKGKNSNQLIQGQNKLIPLGHSEPNNLANVAPPKYNTNTIPLYNTHTLNNAYQRNTINYNKNTISQNNNNPFLNNFQGQSVQNNQQFTTQIPKNKKNKYYDEDFTRGRPIYDNYEIGKTKLLSPKSFIKEPPPQFPIKKIIKPEYEPEKFNKLENDIIKEIKNPTADTSYDKYQEYAVEYGYQTEKKIEQEVKQNPENFLKVEEAVQKKNSNEKLFILGKLGESLENMGIKVVIDKRKNTNNNEVIINNQFISSGLLKKNKYEIHIQESDNNKINQILNDSNERNLFIENWKQNLSNYLQVPKKDIYITNLRHGSIKFDAMLKRENLFDIYGNQLNIDEKMKNFANTNPKIISIFKKNILGACKLTLDMLDEKGNRNPNDWAKPGCIRGGKPYYPPNKDWVGYGLKVLNVYGNDEWIAMNGNPNEWAVAYHGTSESAVKPVCKQDGKFFSTFAEGATGQKCKDYQNVNPYSMSKYPICGEGTYCSPHLDYACGYGTGVIIMCRVDPKLIRIPKGKYQENEWITDGTRNTIRPYRILYNLKNN